MKRAACIIMLVLAPALLFSAGMTEEHTDTVTVTDGLSREVQFPRNPQRIVLAGRANLFLTNAVYLFEDASSRVKALAQTDQGLGDSFVYIDSSHEEKTRLSNQAGAEEIAALRPDLVILKDSMYPRLGDQLEALSIPVLTLGLESYDEYIRDIALLGEVFDDPDRAGQITSYFTGIIEDTAQRAAQASEKPSVLMLYYVEREGAAAFHIPPPDWIQTFMTETAGGRAVWTDRHTGSGWQVVNFEQIAQWDPDMVFFISYAVPSSEVMKVVEDSLPWRNLRAYQNGHVLPFPGDYHSWAQSDIRWFLGIQWLAAQLHPDLFADTDMHELTASFYRDLYGIPEETVQSFFMPRLEEELSGNTK